MFNYTKNNDEMLGFFLFSKNKDDMTMLHFKTENTHYRVICQFTSSELKVCQIGAIVPSNTLLAAIKVLQKKKMTYTML